MAAEDTEKTTTKTVVTEKPSEANLNKFLSLSGYKKEDVDGQNDRRNTFVTTNGGKYRINRKGGLQRLAGPLTPKQAKALAEQNEPEESE